MKKFISFILGIVGGLLGAYGGASGTNKNWRRLGIPILITIIALIVIKHWLVLILMTLIGVLCLGYGIPDVTDSGSPLGRFYYKLTKGNYILTNILTRGTIGYLASLVLLIIPILKGNWYLYALSSFSIIFIYCYYSWKDIGSFKFLGKWLTKSEFVTYFTLTLGTMLLIFIG